MSGNGTDDKIAAILGRWIESTRFLEELAFRSWISSAESPIEKIMGAALYWGDVYGARMDALSEDGSSRTKCGLCLKNVTIKTQAQLDGWRVDFLIEAPNLKIIVECDGHAFHDRTPEQAERDRSRDRKFQLGYVVFRFTGREIVRDAEACARQITGLIETKSGREVVYR